jgi:hypothetical protein
MILHFLARKNEIYSARRLEESLWASLKVLKVTE